MSYPYFIRDLAGLREKLARAERDGTLMGQVWTSVRRRAQAAPGSFPWFTPFVALVTGKESDIAAARQTIRNYVGTFESLPYNMGLQFHFWCYAFPHARWTLAYQWLDCLGAWDADEAARLREELISFQFVNFFYGLRMKPEPECVDNQALALCFSNALFGELFPDSPTAQRMGSEGLRRLPEMLRDLPASGYSGEGSTYMDQVVGPSIPFIVELLGADWFAVAAPVVRMIAREWMPGGLTLPWDHYGYALPVRACIAYGARQTGDPLFLELLERHASWAHDIQVGWGYDDLVWTLIWWPEQAARRTQPFRSWSAPEVGAALISNDANLYLMQMWDHTNPGYPTRAHVNPNAVVLSAFGYPLSVDGVPSRDCHAFEYADTWQELTNMTFKPVRSNFGPGCAGSHSVLLVDGWEGMRAEREGEQARLVAFDEKSVTADVTPLYRQRWPDARVVRRRSRLCHERFWLIEDLAEFECEHSVTARWYFRPRQLRAERGLTIETAEGIRLQLLPLLGPDQPVVRTIAGYPDRLDGESVQANFEQRGTQCRWLWLAWPEQTRAVSEIVADDWEVCADGDAQTYRLPFTIPAFMLADVPVARRWWYRKQMRGPGWLRLPRGMVEPAVWLNGQKVDLASGQLLVPETLLPAGKVEVLVRVDCGISQYDGNDSGFSGQPAVLAARAVEALRAEYRDGVVTVNNYRVPHPLLEVS